MSDKKPAIDFGGQVYILPPKFNLGELRDICFASARTPPTDKGENEKYQFETTVEMMAAAFRRTDPPGPDLDTIYLTETSVAEVLIARMVILAHSELLPKGEPKKGEDTAAA